MKISMMKRIIVVLLAICTLMTQGNLLAFAAETDRNGTFIENIELIVPNQYPNVGDKVQCTLNVTPAEGDYTITWWSDDESIVTVDQNGLVTAVSLGWTKIHVEVDGENSYATEALINVLPFYVTNIILNHTSETLDIGDNLQLAATVEPENATNKEVIWSSDNVNVATVDENGLVTAVGPGDTYIWATAADGHADNVGARACCKISVNSSGEVEAGVNLYKNDTLVGNYDTINDAFDLMTDETADYTVQLCENQVLEGYAQWPKVNSIKIMPVISYYDEGFSTGLYITEEMTTFQSDIIISDWVKLTPYADTFVVYDMNLQSYEMLFTEELAGHNVYFGNIDGTGFHLKGDTGSKVTIENTTQFFFSSLDVDVLEVVYGNPEENGSATLVMDVVARDCKVNTYISEFTPVKGLEIDGLEGEDVLFTIGNIEFADKAYEGNIFTPNAQIESEGYITVEVKNMPADASLSFRYDSREAAATGSFSYTGTVEPKSIGVSVNMLDEGGALGLRDGEGCQPFIAESVLLYAPHVSSDIIGFNYSVQGNVKAHGINMGYTAIRMSGSISGENGYYRTSAFPAIIPSQSVLVFGEDTTKTLSYTETNTGEKLQSVTWTAESTDMTDYSHEDTTNEIIGAYDEDSLEVTYTNKDTNVWTTIRGVFDYGDCEIELAMLLVPSAPAYDVSFSKDKIVTENYMFNYQEIQLNYSADEEPEIFLSCTDYSVVSNLSLSGNTVSFFTGDIGTATIRAYVGDEIVECEVVVKGVEGWHQAVDGNWYYYKDGEVDTSLNGLVYNEAVDEWWYAVEGKADFTYTGLTLYYGTWYYAKNGVLNWSDTYTGLTLFNGTWFYVENSVLKWDYTGLTNYYGTWYYVENGILNWNYTGLVQYYDAWFYVEGGVLNWGYTGLTEYYGAWYYVNGGVLDWGYTGLTEYYGVWYYVNGGVLDWGYTGLTEYYGGWYYVNGGVLDWGYTGLTEYYGAWYYVEGGILNWGFTGLVNHYGTWYYVGNGVLDWSFTGTVYQYGTLWYVENGVLVGAA